MSGAGDGDVAAFRQAARAWLEQALEGRFAPLRGLGDHTRAIDERREWERALAAGGWSCVGWPNAWGGRDASLMQQVAFAEEYARAGAPTRIGHIGVELVGPTLLTHGTEAQRRRYLPSIAAGREIWCQGYSEPNAGSDLAAVRTRAVRDGDHWVLEGQKTWTSMGAFADFCFVLCRTDPDSRGSAGLSYILVDMRQPGVTVRPIRQITGEAEFNEVFFDGARVGVGDVVGAAGDGWRIAMATLGLERGVSTLGQQMLFQNELDAIVEAAMANEKVRDPLIRQRLAQARIGLRIMRWNALRMLSSARAGGLGREGYTYKIYWSTWRRDLGELAMDVLGSRGEIGSAPYDFPRLTALFLGSRADTIYGGSNQIQRNIIAERALGLPREPRGSL